MQPKQAALAGFRLDTDRAVHPLGGFADDRETDASPGIADFGIETLKNPEDAALGFLWDADAIVFKPQADAAVRMWRLELAGRKPESRIVSASIHLAPHGKALEQRKERASSSF